jgi:hypothetical protein
MPCNLLRQNFCKTQVQAIVSNKIICKTEVDPQGMVDTPVKILLSYKKKKKKKNQVDCCFSTKRSGAMERLN